jgi:hypothetical protein
MFAPVSYQTGVRCASDPVKLRECRIIGTSAGELDVAEIATSAANTAAAGLVTIPLVLSLIYFGGVAIGAPVEHDVLPEGHTPITWEVAEPSGYTYGPLAPTTSLTNARCQSWLQDHPGTCPDEQTLAGMYWTKLDQAPQTVYVGILSTCETAPGHFNVEYFQGILTMHCHSAGRLVNVWQGPHSDARAQVVSLLVAVATAGMKRGPLWIYREDRVERWISDIVRLELIGVVTIGGG